MAGSLVLALTVVPIVSGILLKPHPADKPEDVAVIRGLKRVYSPLLDWCLHHRKLVMLGSAAITVPALVLGLYVGSDFMPKLDEGALLLQTILPPEASLDQVDRINHRVEDVLRGFPEVDDVVRRTGRAERTKTRCRTLHLMCCSPEARTFAFTRCLEDAMREKLKSVPGASVLFTTPLGMRIDEGLGGTPADLSVKVFGPDLDQLAQIAGKVRDIMAGSKALPTYEQSN